MMETAQADDEAPRDPGVLKIHQPSYTDEDFEGKNCIIDFYFQRYYYEYLK